MKSLIVVENDHNAEESEIKGKVEKKSGKRIGYNYIILKSLKESQKNDVVKCLYIKSLTNFGFCVIKEGTYGDTKDKHGRDIKDRLVWQQQLHKLLQDKIRLPKFLGSFEENGNYYLVIEHIKGKSLGGLCKRHKQELREALLTGNKLGIHFLSYLLQLIDLLDTLHKYQIVHRDVTTANFIVTPRKEVAVIDMELSYSLQWQAPTPPFRLGTYGYMSPEQELTEKPTIKEDIFSVGAIILQVWSGVSPHKLTTGPFEELEEKVHFFIPDVEIANTITQCLHPVPNNRPDLRKVYQTIKQYSFDKKEKNSRHINSSKFLDPNAITPIIQQGLHTLGTPLLADRLKGWFSEVKNNTGDKNKTTKTWHASFHLGSTGVLYLLSKAKVVGFDISTTLPYIQITLNSIEEKYINTTDKPQSGLHFGSDGIAACLAHAMYDGLFYDQDRHKPWLNQLLGSHLASYGIMDGVSGQGIASLICTPYIGNQLSSKRLQYQISYLLGKQEKNGSWVRSIVNKKSRITKGFAHGIAGILYFLLTYAQQSGEKEVVTSVERGLQWMMKAAVKSSNSIKWRSSKGKEVSPWWCEGGPGIALTFLKAYAVLGDPQYKAYATDALYYHPLRLIDNNLSQCHGLSGLGEIYLEAYRILQTEEWLERAAWLVQVIMRLKKQHIEHGPFWLVEHEQQPVPGFMTGNSGILHFLLRYCYPDKIKYPLISIS